MGLIQREIERAGISTIGISIVREFTEKVRPPRTIYLRWPFGHPLGEPFNVRQQRAVLIEMFNALYTISNAGEIIDVPFKWKRTSYSNYFEMKYDAGSGEQVITGKNNEHRNKALSVMGKKDLKDNEMLYLINRPVFWGLTASLLLLAVIL